MAKKYVVTFHTDNQTEVDRVLLNLIKAGCAIRQVLENGNAAVKPTETVDQSSRRRRKFTRRPYDGSTASEKVLELLYASPTHTLSKNEVRRTFRLAGFARATAYATIAHMRKTGLIVTDKKAITLAGGPTT